MPERRPCHGSAAWGKHAGMNVQEAGATSKSDGSGRSTLDGWVRALELSAAAVKDPARTFPVVIEELADRYGDAPALLSAHECLSHRALAERANRYARWALAQGL